MQRNLGEAVRCYQQAAALGNEPAQARLRALFSSMEAAGTDTSQSQQGPSPELHTCDREGMAIALGVLVISYPSDG